MEREMTERNLSAYLIVDSRGRMRVIRGYKNLKFNEFAIKINIKIPSSFWGSIVPETLNIELPKGVTLPDCVVGDIYPGKAV